MKKKYRKLPRNTDYSAYRHPRWWPTWIAVSLMWCVSRLPIRVQWWLGKLAGLLALRLAGSRRHIAQVNIRLCFPELTAAQQSALVRNAFIANGIGLLELGIAWFRDPAKLTGITRVHGLEHFEEALAHGKGVLLLGGHYSTLDLGGSLVTEFIEADVMQRDHNNPLMNAVMTRARERRYGTVLARETSVGCSAASRRTARSGMPPIRIMAARILFLHRSSAYRRALLPPHPELRSAADARWFRSVISGATMDRATTYISTRPLRTSPVGMIFRMQH